MNQAVNDPPPASPAPPPPGIMGVKPPTPTDTSSWYNILYWFRGQLDVANADSFANAKAVEAAAYRDHAAAIREQAAAMQAFATTPEQQDPAYILAIEHHAQAIVGLTGALHHLAGVLDRTNQQSGLPRV